MKYESYWLNKSALPSYPALTKDVRAEVCVIGGGLAGLSTAQLLQRAGLDVVVLEAGRVGHGTSGRTTAKITLQQGLIYSKLMRLWGQETAAGYATANQAAAEAVRAIAAEGACDLSAQDSYLYTRYKSLLPKLEEEGRAARAAGLSMGLCASGPLPFPIAGALRLGGQAMFHPVKYMGILCRALNGCIYESSRVLRVENGQAFTEKGSVRAKHIVIATHFPFINTPGFYFLRMTQNRSIALALSGAPAISGMHLALEETGLSLRMQGDVLILGSAGGFRCGTEEKTAHSKQLLFDAQALFPGAEALCWWAAQDCMPPDSLPYIGAYSKGLSKVWVISGFQKWGMTQSMLGAQVISGEIIGTPHPQAALFSPARRKLSGMPKLLLADMAMAGHYIAGVPQFACPACAHLGCRLQFNVEEQSWDCPAHGSRFHKDGPILEGPTIKPCRADRYKRL